MTCNGMPVHCCTDCDGRGGEMSHEPDEPSTWWTCCACEGSALITSCADCSDPMPVPEADRQHGRCGMCLAERERGDREEVVERLRRWA
jgi:hypothetical protein